MAVTNATCRGGDSYDFLGLHTDPKPTDCAVNSLFLELDTFDIYYFDGEDWVLSGGD